MTYTNHNYFNKQKKWHDNDGKWLNIVTAPCYLFQNNNTKF